MSETKTLVTHDQAMEAALRLVAGSFRRDGQVLSAKERPRFSVPARPDYDDDIVLCDYIQQQKARKP